MPGASPSRDDEPPLSIAARAAVYTLLATLVGASFVVGPTGPAAASHAAPPEAERAVAHARAMTFRGPRDVPDAEPSSASAPATSHVPEAAAAGDGVPVDVSEPAPEVTVTPSPTIVTIDAALTAEARMLELINSSRARAGLVVLAPDARVAATARAHSAAEALVRFVYHDGADGSAKARDAAACGTGWFGENTGKIWNDNVDALHTEFMAEAWDPINHRTNIMDPAFRRAGIGAVLGPDAMYMTMVFCR